MAGELQLMSSGPQEKFFTLDPDYSHFLESFKKHTNFSNEYVDLDPENEADFGSTVKFKIPQNQGDLLKTLSLKVTLPEITIRVQSGCYIESAGHALIEHVDLIIGGKVIQRLTSDWLQIYSEHFVTQTKQIALEELIGKFPERTAHRRVSNNSGGDCCPKCFRKYRRYQFFCRLTILLLQSPRTCHTSMCYKPSGS